jgi:hypothetical protein
MFAASELEKLADIYGCHNLIDSKTHELIQNSFHSRQIDIVKVQGIEELMTIHEILGTAEQELKHDIMTVKHFNILIVVDYYMF